MRLEQHRHMDLQLGELVMEYAGKVKVELKNMMGKQPEEELRRLLNSILVMAN